MQAEAMAAYTRSLLEPLVTRMTEQETIIRELERENGRLTSEVETLRASQAKQEGRETPAAPRSSQASPFSWPLFLWRWLVLVLVVAVTTLGILLVWPR
jgi:cytochrome c-type biogenesis protein CcmH/NrfG